MGKNDTRGWRQITVEMFDQADIRSLNVSLSVSEVRLIRDALRCYQKDRDDKMRLMVNQDNALVLQSAAARASALADELGAIADKEWERIIDPMVTLARTTTNNDKERG